MNECSFEKSPLAISAYMRAQTEKCKEEIKNLTCTFTQKVSPSRMCPSANKELDNLQVKSKHFLGCTNETQLINYVNNFNATLFNSDEDFQKNRNVSFSKLINNIKTKLNCRNYFNN